MHDPELLILDEPTVGVDPLLRQSIWNHLVHITKAGQKTVIITTHYIEEARQAHTVSFGSRNTLEPYYLRFLVDIHKQHSHKILQSMNGLIVCRN
jgi:energy-coupling factor transporter ATP-binding protein EcfA2